MKILNIYLSLGYNYLTTKKLAINTPPGYITASYYEFIDSVYEINNNITYGRNLVLNTFCLAALDFEYLKIFDEINVKGNSLYARFRIKDKKDNISSNTIIDYNVYDYDNNDYTYNFKKELRYSHNLYNLVTKGYFKRL